VIRDGAAATIPARDVVPGDLLAIDEGERIAADALLLTTEALQVDESLLTGESVPVRKRPAAPGETADADARPGGEDEPSVYSGTLAVAGHGLARVTATGAATRTGAIGLSLSTIEVGRTTLQQSTAKIVRLFGLIALIVCSALVIWYGLAFGDWIEGVLSGIAIAMSLLPEEFPVAMAVFLAIGAWRLSQIKVLARRPAIIETLGATTVLCVDKTGTLTRNRMRVARVSVDRHWVEAERDAVAADARVGDLLRTAWFASRHGSFDPMDLAVEAACERTGAVTMDQHADWPILREYPLSPDLLAFTQVWREPDGDRRVATKGAPEAMFQRAVRFLSNIGSPASIIFSDDVEIFARCQHGLKREGHEWVSMARGHDSDRVESDGLRESTTLSEAPVRAQFGAWLRHMTSEAAR